MVCVWQLINDRIKLWILPVKTVCPQTLQVRTLPCYSDMAGYMAGQRDGVFLTISPSRTDVIKQAATITSKLNI